MQHQPDDELLGTVPDDGAGIMFVADLEGIERRPPHGDSFICKLNAILILDHSDQPQDTALNIRRFYEGLCRTLEDFASSDCGIDDAYTLTPPRSWLTISARHPDDDDRFHSLCFRLDREVKGGWCCSVSIPPGSTQIIDAFGPEGLLAYGRLTLAECLAEWAAERGFHHLLAYLDPRLPARRRP